jgi:Domain of unknown function (DUF4413)
MSIASVLDPRFKLLSIDFTFKRMYPAEEVGTRIEKVIETLKSLYEKYLNEHRASKVTASTSNHVVSNLISRKMMISMLILNLWELKIHLNLILKYTW